MTVAYRCDGPGCGNVLDQEQTRIDVSVTNEPIKEGPADPLDPEYMHFATIKIGFEADQHFCSMACLSAWAFAKQLETA